MGNAQVLKTSIYTRPKTGLPFPVLLELTQLEMAQAFGVTTRQIRNWEADGLAGRTAGNRRLYPLAHAIQFYAARQAEKAVARHQKAKRPTQ